MNISSFRQSLVLLIILLSSCTINDKKFNEQKGWILLTENKCLDDFCRKNNNIYCGGTSCDAKAMKDIDVNSFKVYIGSKYAKDIKHVYYPLSSLCVDGTDCGVCYCTKYIIKGANSQSFEYLCKDYAKDKKHVYFRGELIAKANSLTFSVKNGPEFCYFAVDKNYVFLYDKIFKDADPSSFRFDSIKQKGNDFGRTIYVLKDTNHIWEYSPPEDIKLIK